MENKTAVEWLMEQITYDNGNGERYNSFIDTVDLLEYFNQALEIEKQQIIDTARIARQDDFWEKYKSYEDYYDEIYSAK